MGTHSCSAGPSLAWELGIDGSKLLQSGSCRDPGAAPAPALRPLWTLVLII